MNTLTVNRQRCVCPAYSSASAQLFICPSFLLTPGSARPIRCGTYGAKWRAVGWHTSRNAGRRSSYCYLSFLQRSMHACRRSRHIERKNEIRGPALRPSSLVTKSQPCLNIHLKMLPFCRTTSSRASGCSFGTKMGTLSKWIQ